MLKPFFIAALTSFYHCPALHSMEPNHLLEKIEHQVRARINRIEDLQEAMPLFRNHASLAICLLHKKEFDPTCKHKDYIENALRSSLLEIRVCALYWLGVYYYTQNNYEKALLLLTALTEEEFSVSDTPELATLRENVEQLLGNIYTAFPETLELAKKYYGPSKETLTTNSNNNDEVPANPEEAEGQEQAGLGKKILFYGVPIAASLTIAYFGYSRIKKYLEEENVEGPSIQANTNARNRRVTARHTPVPGSNALVEKDDSSGPTLATLLKLGGIALAGLAALKKSWASSTNSNSDNTERIFENPSQLNESFLDSVRNKQLQTLRQRLSEGADINYRDQHGMTCLHYGVKNGSIPLLLELLARGADKTIKDENFKTPYHYAKEQLVYMTN